MARCQWNGSKGGLSLFPERASGQNGRTFTEYVHTNWTDFKPSTWPSLGSGAFPLPRSHRGDILDLTRMPFQPESCFNPSLRLTNRLQGLQKIVFNGGEPSPWSIILEQDETGEGGDGKGTPVTANAENSNFEVVGQLDPSEWVGRTFDFPFFFLLLFEEFFLRWMAIHWRGMVVDSVVEK